MKMLKITGAWATALFLVLPGIAGAETYYVSPPDSVASGIATGSAEKPFIGVNAAFKSGVLKSGDILLLRDGSYGPLVLRNVTAGGPIKIKSENKRRALFDSISLTGTTQNLTFQNLSIWPQKPDSATGYLFITDPTTSGIIVSGLDIRSEQGANDYVNWTSETWNKRKVSGIRLDGKDSRALKNTLTGIYMGITTSGANAKVAGNLIKGYNGDGLRPLGTDNVYKGNTVIDCVSTDDNHDDGIQSMATVGGVVKGLVIDSNVILEWTKTPNHPLRCTLQGIGFFDGFYDDLTITNNLVSVSNYHGISVYGTRGAVISNNTVVNSFGLTSVTPYIAVYNHKNGTPPTNVLVANNLAMSIRGTASQTNKVEFRDNSVIGTPRLVFQEPSSFDYRPKLDSGYVDSADPRTATARDISGSRRPLGGGPDRGAYENKLSSTVETSTTPTAGTPTTNSNTPPGIVVVRRAGVVEQSSSASGTSSDADSDTGTAITNPALIPTVLPEDNSNTP